MSRPLSRLMVLVVALLALAADGRAYPKPSAYPIAWQLNFEYQIPQRIVVTIPGSLTAKAYWYMTYTVTNLTDKEQKFYPAFVILLDDGRLFRSDNNIPQVVLDTIRIREKRSTLESATEIAGIIRVGEDQARDGVAIWEEPTVEMGRFSVFVGGLSGESTILTDDAGQPVVKTDKDGKKDPVVLHRTLQLDFHVPGDEKFPSLDKLRPDGDPKWVMR